LRGAYFGRRDRVYAVASNDPGPNIFCSLFFFPWDLYGSTVDAAALLTIGNITRCSVTFSLAVIDTHAILRALSSAMT
jgi:hypothetical protein